MQEKKAVIEYPLAQYNYFEFALFFRAAISNILKQNKLDKYQVCLSKTKIYIFRLYYKANGLLYQSRVLKIILVFNFAFLQLKHAPITHKPERTERVTHRHCSFSSYIQVKHDNGYKNLCVQAFDSTCSFIISFPFSPLNHSCGPLILTAGRN